MPSYKTGSKISCAIRCLEADTVEVAMRELDSTDLVRIPYACQLSGKKEEVLLIGDQLAFLLAETVPEIMDTGDARILAGLTYAELCECDVATLVVLPENDVVDRLQKFSTSGVLAHREQHGMNYYCLSSEKVRKKIEALL